MEGDFVAENVFQIDQSRSMFEQEVPGHNRWHPEIPPAATVRLPPPPTAIPPEAASFDDVPVTSNVPEVPAVWPSETLAALIWPPALAVRLPAPPDA